MRRVLACALGCALMASTSAGLDEATRFWLSMRGSAHFFTDGDHQDLEDLSFGLSNPEDDYPIEFYEKSWEIPFGARFGLQLTPGLSVFAMYERIPYLLDAERSIAIDSAPYRTDTVILRAPANLFGGGADFALFRGTYGGGLRMGVATGILDVEGADEDWLGRNNFLVDATGWFFDLYASLEYDFSRELGLYPFAQFRLAKADDTTITTFDTDPIPDFELDYTGLALGIEIRIRAWPLPSGGD